MQTIAWRHEWEATKTPSLKAALVTYNAQDCEALELVARKLVDLHQDGVSPNDVVRTERLKHENLYGFKRNTFSFPELNAINKAAYWDYQRERVYVKSNSFLKVALTRSSRARKAFSPNKIPETHDSY